MINIQKEFDNTGARTEYTLTVETNGGYITIEASLDGQDYVLTDAINKSGGYVVYHGRARLRITPFDGAEYEYI